MTIRFYTGDALAFCYLLQHRQSGGDKLSPHLYRDPFHSETLISNDEDYSATVDVPSMFNVIDTSNLLDHLGPLNVLTACVPVLSD